jgi:very-short-patch-repair endonuclease
MAKRRYTQNPVEKRLGKALRDCGIKVSPQFCFDTDRLWRLDFAIPSLKIGIEVEGRDHQRLAQVKRDHDKFNRALILGWRILRYSAQTVMTKKRLPLILDQIKELVYDSPSENTHVHSGED